MVTLVKQPPQAASGGPAESDPLAIIAAEAAQLEADSAPPPPPGTAPPAPVMTNAEALLPTLKAARATIAPGMRWWRDFADVWSDEQLDEMAQAWGAVLDLHGTSVGELAGKWGPYIAAAGVTIGPAWTTYQAVQDYQRFKASRAGQAEAPAAPPGAAP